MKTIRTLFTMVMLALTPALTNAQETRYAGGDISLLDKYEKAGAVYKTPDGQPIADLLPWLAAQGMNAMRVRVFVDPTAYKGNDADPNACQTVESVLPLCRRIKEAGMKLMLDFHYSDTWADPAKQYTPAAWAGLGDAALADTLHAYTRRSLQLLKDAGCAPDFIQPGNEISYGMLWGPEGTPDSAKKKTFMGSDANWQRLGNLLNAAISACRGVCPEAQIVIHTERTAQTNVQKNFYDRMASLKVDYDIIGLSYYPYFHGNLTQLGNALKSLAQNFSSKKVMIVEAGYPYAWEVPGTTQKVEWAYSEAGQEAFAKDLVDLLMQYSQVDGLFWWWMEYNAYGTSLSGWYNAPLFDSRNGRATPALKTICSYATPGASVNGIEVTDDAPVQWYDLTGRPVTPPLMPGIYLSRGRKVMVSGCPGL